MIGLQTENKNTLLKIKKKKVEGEHGKEVK